MSTLTLVQADETGELFIQFTDEQLSRLGWEKGDTLVWTIVDDVVTIKKKD